MDRRKSFQQPSGYEIPCKMLEGVFAMIALWIGVFALVVWLGGIGLIWFWYVRSQD